MAGMKPGSTRVGERVTSRRKTLSGRVLAAIEAKPTQPRVVWVLVVGQGEPERVRGHALLTVDCPDTEALLHAMTRRIPDVVLVELAHATGEDGCLRCS